MRTTAKRTAKATAKSKPKATARRAPLATVGYEGASLEALVAALRKARVKIVLDVRDVPWSRRAEFTKNRLAAALETAGIGYRHMQALGTPKAGRDAAKAGDRATFAKLLAARLDSPEGQGALAEAARLAAEGGLCLLCFERDPARCHRSIVAERLEAMALLDVRHLDPLDVSSPRPMAGGRRK
jgi:uncharacterized protein (DUF488 family)